MFKPILKGLIYRFVEGEVSAYSSDETVYNCCVPDFDWTETTQIGDVWVCDEIGNIDPGLSNSPVPVSRDTIGDTIGRAKGRLGERLGED